MQAVDLYDSATFERGIPHDYFSWLREHEPIHWQPPREIKTNVAGLMEVKQRGYWAVTRRRDIIEVSLDQADSRFSATRLCWSIGIGGCDDSMKFRLLSSGCKTRPARGEPARAGNEPCDGLGNGIGEA